MVRVWFEILKCPIDHEENKSFYCPIMGDKGYLINCSNTPRCHKIKGRNSYEEIPLHLEFDE